MSYLLKTSLLTVAYHQADVLSDVSIEVQPGQIVSLVGANGAGKSTLMKTLVGILPPKKGDILFKGKSILGLKSHEIIQMGMSQSPEGRQVFSGMSVLENLLLGLYVKNFGRKETNERLEETFSFFPVLREKQKMDAGSLSGGEQQMLALGRALMPQPDLLLLDEPTLGISPALSVNFFDILMSLSRAGMGILMAEQNAILAMEISNYGYIIESGKIVNEGQASELLQDDKIKKAYLGL